MKPDAAPEIRGEFKPIRSRLPGLDVCELLPNAAKVMDKVTVVRSMTHPYPIHGVAYATTGVPTIDVPMELNPHDGRHWPFIGSVVDYLTAGKRGEARGGADEHRPAVAVQHAARRRGAAGRPLRRLPGRGLQPASGRPSRARRRAPGPRRFRTRSSTAASRTWASRRKAASSWRPRPTCPPRSRSTASTGAAAWCSSSTAPGAQRDDSAAGRQLDRYREMAYDLIGSEKVRHGPRPGPRADASCASRTA